MIKTFTFKIGACFAGDLIYMLPGIKNACERNEAKAAIYLWLDRPVKSYEGAAHPLNGVGYSRLTYDMLKPLVESQPYVQSFEVWAGQEYKVDLDELRQKVIAPIPYGSITRWPFYAWPDMQCDLAKAWLNVQCYKIWEPELTVTHVVTGLDFTEVINKCSGKIIINRTSRWRNPMIHYWFLREYKEQLIFAGLPEEHAAFCKEWELEIPLLVVKDFMELAIALASCKYFIGNQSMCFALAEAMKIPRLLEVCPYAPNVIPCGEHGYDFLHQFSLEWMVKDVESPLNKL